MKFTSLGKKIVAILAVFTFMVSLAGCFEPTTEDTLEQAQKNVNAVVGSIVFDSSKKDSLTSNLPLTNGNKQYPNVKIEWTSSEEDVIKIEEVTNDKGETSLQGTVTRPDFDDPRIADDHVAVTLTVKATQTVKEGTAEKTETYTFRVKAVTLEKFGTIAEIKDFILNDLKDRKIALNVSDAKNGKFCMTYGRVLYQWSKSMVISDGTDSIIVYGSYDVETGDLVQVSGKVYSYYGQVEFGSEQQVNKLKATDKVINPMTKEEICKQEEILACKYVDMEIQAYTDALIAAQSESKRVVDVAGIMGFSGATYKLYAKVLKEDLGCGDKYALEDPKTGTRISIYHYATDGTELTNVIDQFVGKYVYINCITIDRYSSNDVFRVLWNGEKPVEAPAPELTDADKVQQAVNELKNTKLEDAYYDGQVFTLPTTKVEGVQVEWAANSALVDGKLTVAADTELEFTATFTCGEATAQATIKINVYKEMKFITVAEAKAAAKDTQVLLKGLVSAVYARGFVLYDTTGSILVYANKAVEVKVGDYVKVGGKTGAYPADSTAYQIGSPSYEILNESTDLTLPEAVEWTGADVKAAWDQVVAGSYNFAGNLVKMTITVTDAGNYYNATVDGADTKLSISYPLEAVKGYLEKGKTLTGYFVPISYSNSKDVPTYFNLILVEVEASDQQKADALVNGLNVPTTVETDFELPTVEGVVWAMKEENASATLEGTKVTVTRGEADVTVVFVATATVNGVKGEKEYTVTVKGVIEEKPEHAGTEADPYTVKDARMVCDKLEDKAYSDEMFYVKGIVVSVTFNSKYSSYTLYIGDTENATEQFQVYSGNLAEGVEAPKKGATVVAYGYMQKYGSNLELAGKSGTYPTISSVVNPTVDPTPVDENVVTYTWTANDGTLVDNVLTIETEDFTIIISKNKSTSNVVNTYAECRIYQGASVQIIAKNGKKISSVSFQDLGGKNPTSVDFSLDANSSKLTYAVSSNVWTFTASEGLDSMTFATVKQMRFATITVTFAE